MNYVQDWVSQYLPNTPEPPPSVPKFTVFISDEARLAVKRARAIAAVTGVPVPFDAAVAAEEEWDDEVDVAPVRSSPRYSSSTSVAHGGSFDEPTEAQTSVPVRASPRRQQLSSGDVDMDADTLRMLDSATAHAIVRTNRVRKSRGIQNLERKTLMQIVP